MERIQVDFAIQRGHEMILRRDPPLTRADLDEVDMQMLQAVRPPGLLAVDWFEMDGSVTFRYAIDGRKLLPHRLITGPFGMNDYIGLLLGIVEALDNCGHYLLKESCCLLEEKFLFIGGDWRDVALTYLPLRDPSVKKPVREELLGLAVRLIGKVERVDGNAMQAMLRLLDDPAASWSKIRVGLLHMLATERRAGDEPSDAADVRDGRSVPGSRQPDAGGYSAAIAPLTDADPPGAAHARQPDLAASALADHWPDESAERLRTEDDGSRPEGGKRGPLGLFDKLFGSERPADTAQPETMMFDDREWPGATGRIRDTGRARWLSACGAVLAVALIWRYIYLPSPGTDRLLISAGATLLAAGGLFLLWQRLAARNHEPLDDPGPSAGSGDPDPDAGVPASRRPEPESDVRSGQGGRTDVAELRFPWLTEFARDHESAPGVGYAMPEAPSADRWPAGQSTGEPEMAGFTVMPHTIGTDGADTGQLQDETVWLGRDGGGKFWLVREHEGQHRRIPVEPGIRVVGRSEAHAGIIDTAEGVSRAHLEIACEDGEVRIKDLASRNGTLLEGEIMIPYKEYVLHEGGEFRLAGPDGPKYTLRRSG